MQLLLFHCTPAVPAPEIWEKTTDRLCLSFWATRRSHQLNGPDKASKQAKLSMGRNQRKNSGNSNNQSRSTPPRENREDTIENPIHKQMAGMSEIEFRVWIANKINRLEETKELETQEMIQKISQEITQKVSQEIIQKMTQELNDFKDKMIKDFEILRQEVAALKDLKDTVESLRNRVQQAEERISDTEDKAFEEAQERKDQKKWRAKTDLTLRELLDNSKKTNIRLIGIPEGDEVASQNTEALLHEIMKENFPDMPRDSEIQIADSFRTPARLNPNKTSPRHIIINFTKVKMKEKILKAVRQKKTITYKGKSIRMTADLSAETFQARRGWSSTFNLLKQNNFQPRILYPAKLSFIYDGEIKYFNDINTLKKFAITKPALQETLKPILHNDQCNPPPQK